MKWKSLFRSSAGSAGLCWHGCWQQRLAWERVCRGKIQLLSLLGAQHEAELPLSLPVHFPALIGSFLPPLAVGIKSSLFVTVSELSWFLQGLLLALGPQGGPWEAL